MLTEPRDSHPPAHTDAPPGLAKEEMLKDGVLVHHDDHGCRFENVADVHNWDDPFDKGYEERAQSWRVTRVSEKEHPVETMKQGVLFVNGEKFIAKNGEPIRLYRVVEELRKTVSRR